MFDATLGRLMERDPLGVTAPGGNIYAYAGNRPAHVTDPLGEDDDVKDRVNSLIADLESDNFQTRQTATDELRKLLADRKTRGLVTDALKQALGGKPSLEADKRMKGILESHEKELCERLRPIKKIILATLDDLGARDPVERKRVLGELIQDLTKTFKNLEDVYDALKQVDSELRAVRDEKPLDVEKLKQFRIFCEKGKEEECKVKLNGILWDLTDARIAISDAMKK